MRDNAFMQPIKSWPNDRGCQCYPECRNDCPDSMKCYDAMPEYWSKEYRARKYAEGVRERKPETFGAKLPKVAVRMGRIRDENCYWDVRDRVWRIPHVGTILGAT